MAAALQQQPSLLRAAEATPGQQLTTAPVRQRLLSAFATLNSYGIAALPAEGTDPGTTRTQLHNAILQQFPAALGFYACYTASQDTHFDTDGHLQQPLTLHVSGEKVTRAVHAALNPRRPPRTPRSPTRHPAAHPPCRRTIVTQQDKNRNNLTSCEAHPPNRSTEAERARNRGRRSRRPIGRREPWVTNGLAQASTFLSGNR